MRGLKWCATKRSQLNWLKLQIYPTMSTLLLNQTGMIYLFGIILPWVWDPLQFETLRTPIRNQSVMISGNILLRKLLLTPCYLLTLLYVCTVCMYMYVLVLKITLLLYRCCFIVANYSNQTLEFDDLCSWRAYYCYYYLYIVYII